ncbi:hypothetical protein VC83_08452 [Pseudogymnoascus destructans]|uniref:Uncharacterized protein n=1 Tax=Pseudogymnoascus destructans TaxID=655981 RepID=A0A176ZYL3_9PEZI|nr:uncharacterized protein VC83_08452 [Pseudogymnoascus destructans]OAF55135.1 hypothetical protein VC83_08452 [Pseudogymnoascus destructans]
MDSQDDEKSPKSPGLRGLNSSATSKADRMPSKLAALKNRIEEERAYYNTMEEALQVFRRSHGDDYSAYPEEVRVFAERQARIQEEGRQKRPFGKVKDPKVYKGKSTRELNEFMASIRASF